MANVLKTDKQAAVIRSLIEGSSVRSTERLTGVHRDTILRLMVRVASRCQPAMDSMLRGLNCRRLQLDEIWAYVGKKQRQIKVTDDQSKCGDFWTYVALDADSKLIPAYRVGKRDAANTVAFVQDLASRLRNRVQLSSDMLKSYVDAVELGFGGQVDYGRIVKSYETEPIGPGRYSPPRVCAITKDVVAGNPDPAHIATSFVERQNLTMRMSMRRFTRLTNAFSKKVENLKAAVALHVAHYNFVRPHKTLGGITPAMAAGVAGKFWTVENLVELAQ